MANHFVGIADTLALVRLGGSFLTHVSRKLTNLLLVDTVDNDSVRVGNINGDAFNLIDIDLMIAVSGDEAAVDALG